MYVQSYFSYVKYKDLCATINPYSNRRSRRSKTIPTFVQFLCKSNKNLEVSLITCQKKFLALKKIKLLKISPKKSPEKKPSQDEQVSM